MRVSPRMVPMTTDSASWSRVGLVDDGVDLQFGEAFDGVGVGVEEADEVVLAEGAEGRDGFDQGGEGGGLGFDGPAAAGDQFVDLGWCGGAGFGGGGELRVRGDRAVGAADLVVQGYVVGVERLEDLLHLRDRDLGQLDQGADQPQPADVWFAVRRLVRAGQLARRGAGPRAGST